MEREKIDVNAIAALARLEFSDEERIRLAAEMKEFDLFAACLDGTSGTEAIEKAMPLENCHAREDTHCPFEHSREILNGAKSTYNGYITVPKTVKGGDEE